MTASSYRQSAKIYQFPAGGRAALGGRRDEAMAVENFAVPRSRQGRLGRRLVSRRGRSGSRTVSARF